MGFSLRTIQKVGHVELTTAGRGNPPPPAPLHGFVDQMRDIREIVAVSTARLSKFILILGGSSFPFDLNPDIKIGMVVCFFF